MGRFFLSMSGNIPWDGNKLNKLSTSVAPSSLWMECHKPLQAPSILTYLPKMDWTLELWIKFVSSSSLWTWIPVIYRQMFLPLPRLPYVHDLILYPSTLGCFSVVWCNFLKLQKCYLFIITNCLLYQKKKK